MNGADAPSHIKDLVMDPKNARRHNARNVGMIERSLEECGAARSIVIDENNVILAGNGVVEAAGNVGIESVKVVEATGNEVVAVRRRGLSERQKRELAVYDNRTSDLSDWSPELLKVLDVDLSKFWTPLELAVVLQMPELPDGIENEPSGKEHVCPKCGYRFTD